MNSMITVSRDSMMGNTFRIFNKFNQKTGWFRKDGTLFHGQESVTEKQAANIISSIKN